MAYQELYQDGRLKKIGEELRAKLKSCSLCPRNCKVNRLKGELGFCRTGLEAVVSSAFLHFNEEAEIVGRGGSGTIFFSHCNLGCIYCQNHTLSHLGEGESVSCGRLAEMMLSLQAAGAENINFVTPSHVVAQIVQALAIAAEGGLKIPLVYNCGGYESLEVLKLIDGVFDIYMPDFKYSGQQPAQMFSKAGDYWQVACAAIKEMHYQVGDLAIEAGLARGGLLIRHLVLPEDIAGSRAVLDFIRNELSADTYVNIMDQYRPCYQASSVLELSRRISFAEYRSVIQYAGSIGLHRGFRKEQ